jgi:hypothetical protein
MLHINVVSKRMKVKYDGSLDFVSSMSRKLFDGLFSIQKYLVLYKRFLYLDKNEKLSKLLRTTAGSQ